MSYRLPPMLVRVARPCALLALSACTQVADVGGEAAPGSMCSERCEDAGSGMRFDAGPEQPEASVPSADAATYKLFTARLNGLWRGVSAVPAGDESMIGPRFEITLAIEPGGVSGSFVVRCVDQETGCDPFGIGSARPEGGTFEMSDLVTKPWLEAIGTFAWGRGTRVPFWAMRRAERPTGAVLTFDVGYYGAAPGNVAAYRVVLAEGPWPDAGMSTPDAASAEGRAPDGGLTDSALVDGKQSDAGDIAMGDR